MNTIADLLRLLAIPAFAWVAYRDVTTRRVTDRAWVGLGVLACVAFLIDLVTLDGPARGFFLIRTAVSVCLLVPLSYLFWRIGGFGGADAKAFIVLAGLFPAFPVYEAFGVQFPQAETAIGVFSFSIVTNTVIIGLAYPIWLAARNVANGEIAPRSFVARRVSVENATDHYGRLFDAGSGGSSLDLDALRMYLRWRGTTLDTLRSDPETCRDPTSLPADPNPPGDGAIRAESPPLTESVASDGGRRSNSEDTNAIDPRSALEPGERKSEHRSPAGGAAHEDPWGARTFLSDIDSTAYGTTPTELRDGLDALTTRKRIWISPGIPFLVPLFVGLCFAVGYGDLLFAGLDVLGVL